MNDKLTIQEQFNLQVEIGKICQKYLKEDKWYKVSFWFKKDVIDEFHITRKVLNIPFY